MSKQDRQRLRDLASKAAPGPWSAEYIASVSPDVIIRLLDHLDKADELADCVYPLLNLDCEVTGTCRDCLKDGRGTHTEQAEHALAQYQKANKKNEIGKSLSKLKGMDD